MQVERQGWIISLVPPLTCAAVAVVVCLPSAPITTFDWRSSFSRLCRRYCPTTRDDAEAGSDRVASSL